MPFFIKWVSLIQWQSILWNSFTKSFDCSADNLPNLWSKPFQSSIMNLFQFKLKRLLPFLYQYEMSFAVIRLRNWYFNYEKGEKRWYHIDMNINSNEETKKTQWKIEKCESERVREEVAKFIRCCKAIWNH